MKTTTSSSDWDIVFRRWPITAPLQGVTAAKKRYIEAIVESLSIIFGRSRHAALFCLLALGAGAGCQSTPAPTAAPAATGLEVTVEDADQPQPAAPRPTYADGYPSFAGSLNAANVQMTNEEAQALQFRLTALSKARKAGTISEAEYQAKLAELRKLAAEHGADTQALIAK